MTTVLRSTALLLLLSLGLALLPGCGGEEPPAATAGAGGADDHDHAHGTGPHGGPLVVTSDHAVHLEVVHDQAAGRVHIYPLTEAQGPLALDEAPVLNVVGEDGSERIAGTADGDGWVFQHDLLAGHVEGRFRIKFGGKTYTPPLEHAHGHAHAGHGPHDGVVAPLGAGVWLELKLHDDKGDLELWLARDEAITKPFDLPLDTTVTVTFESPRQQAVTLRVRNKERNEDEDDQATVRDGRTNYFIFPGDTGADATWLQGADFHGKVVVSVDGRSSEAFDLRPHTH